MIFKAKMMSAVNQIELNKPINEDDYDILEHL